MKTVEDIVNALGIITGGRTVSSMDEVKSGDHPFVILKSSGIYGKEVLEIPGLVYGSPAKQVKKIAVCMTMTELVIELAGATGVDAIVAHHPMADAASCGGVTLKNYLDLYNIAGLECHEAFHGLHPGIAFLHGHKITGVDISYGGVHGNIMFVGKALEGVSTLGDILDRLDAFMALDQDRQLLEQEQRIRGVASIQETTLETKGFIHIGNRSDQVKNVLHIFPHTGFSAENLITAVRENPQIDTVIASISRVYSGHPLVETAKDLGVNFIVGNCHVMEILENGLPLAYALEELLEGVEVVLFRDRVTSTPVKSVGNNAMRDYAKRISEAHLLGKNATDID
ncbi:Nif3-like dinuclear metal center hexameric protein [Marinobacter sp. X15-166B]|uniref:Nif3-like dinuclear metal center hexameric protein n=1 Tax=Marinobacter sp. X15-166B TaxID=1897620 RepID=UPI00085CD340|nr:Nif3-like dinuclear metal center hexameric protein [Marinobacter sp. X15-166B]OEY66012.1 NGG1p interacting factor NIF3 [Marinobacter sp. X15-166B]